MIVYQSTKGGFLNDVLSNDIENKILTVFKEKFGHSTAKNEILSWKNSMMYMNTVLADSEIPDDSRVAIEYKIPQTSRRIDFVLTGQDDKHVDHAVIIELKQWSVALPSFKDGIVSTFLGGTERETSHPSYQAWSYATLLQSFNQTVYEEKIQLKPCAYLHNYEPDNVINNDFYKEYIDKAPIFLKPDALKLRDFIKKFVKYGDTSNLMYRIDNGKIKPSKSLADSLSSLLQGNQEFVMIDDQKIVFEAALDLAKKSTTDHKNVLIVEGGPGTGKTVLAMNLLVALTGLEMNARYVTKNAAPRAVYESKLTGSFRKSEISNMFTGSGAFTDCEPNSFDVLVVDEAHRLNEKSGMFQNLGENQIKEVLQAAKFSIFFIDEDQKVTFKDIGEKDEILEWADELGVNVHELELTSQFRCNGSDGYLAWLDNILQIRETANTSLDNSDYDFRVLSSPNELRDLIFEKNKLSNKARLVAGYCWEWKSKGDPSVNDIEIPEHDFGMRWNLASDGGLWILKQESVKEVGCIHTSQGLEVDYVGVIVGSDLLVRNGQIVTDPSKRARSDASLKGFKTLLKNDPLIAVEKADSIIKNTYRTLMTRGMKGCYVYFVDKETEEYFKSKIK